MQVNLDCNCPKPQFGMAFRKPLSQKAANELAEYVGLDTKLGARAFKQFVDEQKAVTHYDIQFNPKNKSFDIINNSKTEVMATFPHLGEQKGFDIFGEYQYLGRKLLAKIFNPKRFLPKNLYLAGECAKRHEANAIKNEEMANNINKLF